jgi:RecJ-like exonuclease
MMEFRGKTNHDVMDSLKEPIVDNTNESGVSVHRTFDEEGRVVSEAFSREDVTCPECRGSGKVQLLTTISTCGACCGKGKVSDWGSEHTYDYSEYASGNETESSDDPQK